MVDQTTDYFNLSRLTPQFIYNRFDLWCENFIVLHVHNEKSDYIVQARLLNNHAELGVWMMEVSGRDFDEISQFIFSKYKQIEYISLYNAISDMVLVAKNHYHVILPESYDSLAKRISAKSRNTMSRKKKKAEMEYGVIRLAEYEGEEITEDIVSAYFEMKENTHHIKYGLTCREYLRKYHVSNVYILHFGDRVASIILTCEQCPIVYLENLTYDTELSKYSPGMMAYDMVLERLITKGKKEFFLGGGDYDYKKKYDSIETIVTDGRIYRSFAMRMKYSMIDFYNKHLYWKVRQWKRKLSF
ncbi:MAG: GNAT family N-acetyltransferase [Prevotella sp.]|nr:GNAT family N-acetyltransferase [Prevotella sp.]